MLVCDESWPRVAHLERPQSDVDISVDAVRLEHCLNGTGGEGQHGLLVLVEEPPIYISKHTHAHTPFAVYGLVFIKWLFKRNVYRCISSLTLKTPLLYMCTSEKAKPCVNTLSNQPFMMAGTLNQYSGNCGSGDTRTHTHTPLQSEPVPASFHNLLPLTSDLEDDELSRLHFALLRDDVVAEAALLPGVHGLLAVLEQLGVFGLT